MGFTPDFNTEHRCVDYEALSQWRRDQTVLQAPDMHISESCDDPNRWCKWKRPGLN